MQDRFDIHTVARISGALALAVWLLGCDAPDADTSQEPAKTRKSAKRAASGKTAKSAATSKPVTSAPTPAPSVDLSACSTLSRTHCMSSTTCTLIRDPADAGNAQYLCRESKDPCERGLVQTDSKACEKRAACKFVGADCYCACRGYGRTSVEDGPEAPGCACACGGGTPSRCMVK